MKSACGHFALMRPMSHQAGVAYVTWALVEPPFDIELSRSDTVDPKLLI